jgi:mRNA-degrading endonuclease toxin of MazEF toxin-antitoxin module
VIQPGAVFEIPADLAEPPQRRLKSSPPARESRWVVIVNNKRDCRDPYPLTALVVLLSAKVEYAGRHDVHVVRPDGGVQRDSIAQVDLLFTLLKEDLAIDRYRGTLMSDTLRQIRAKLADTLGVAGSEDPG